MDKIAIISDIHGNKAALTAVLDDIHLRNINKIFCIGDIVVKCANPDVTIDLVRKNCDIVLQGNCDEIMASDKALEKKFWTRLKIGEERAKYLHDLPIMYEFYLSGQLIRLFHASPYSLSHIYNPMFSNKNSKYYSIEIPNPLELFANTPFIGKTEDDPIPDIIGYGHIHTPNTFKIKNKTIFNPGSVGAPVEMLNSGDLNDKSNRFSTLASYTILEGVLNSKDLAPISITNVRIPYNMETEILDLENSDMPSRAQFIFSLKTASSN